MLQFDRYDDHARSVVWDCVESSAQALSALPAAWRERLPEHPDRLRETLGARRALLALGEELAAHPLGRDAYGKPFLEGRPDLHFSLSHSHRRAAALVSDRRCGVDLQLRVAKILRLRSKFERDDERAFIASQPDEIGALHILFGAKEALFKLWGARRIDWHEHLVVQPFALDANVGEARGEIRRDGAVIEAQLHYRWMGDFCLVVALQR